MKTKGPGRPRTRAADLVVFNAQMSRRAKRRLQALAQLDGTSASMWLEEAFWARWGKLSGEKREAAETIAAAIERARGEG